MPEAEPLLDSVSLPSPLGGRGASVALRALLDRILPAPSPRDDRGDEVALRTATGA